MKLKHISLLAWYNILVYAFILLPIVVVVMTSFTASGVNSFPPQGLSLRWYQAILDNPEFIDSFRISVTIASLTAVAAVVLGVLGALGLARYWFPGRELLSAFFLSPLMVPTIVIGMILLLFYSRVGIPKSFLSIAIGHIILATPYVIRLVYTSLVGIDRTLELAARNLGASAWEAFRRITVPLIIPGLIAGGAFAFIISFDDVSVAIFLASPKTITLSVRIFTYIEHSSDPMITAVNSTVIIIAAVLLVFIEPTFGVGKLFSSR